MTKYPLAAVGEWKENYEYVVKFETEGLGRIHGFYLSQNANTGGPSRIHTRV
jgi:hypothetical protein